MWSRVIVFILIVLVAFGLLFVQAWALQAFHDSCRIWREPPPWASFCPPSTRNGVR